MVTGAHLDATAGQRMDSLPGLQSSSFRAGPWLSPLVKKKSSRETGVRAREGEESGLPVASQRNEAAVEVRRGELQGLPPDWELRLHPVGCDS